jgi:hypothetical protein
MKLTEVILSLIESTSSEIKRSLIANGWAQHPNYKSSFVHKDFPGHVLTVTNRELIHKHPEKGTAIKHLTNAKEYLKELYKGK